MEANGSIFAHISILDVEFFELESLEVLSGDAQFNGSLSDHFVDVVFCTVPIIVKVCDIPNKFGNIVLFFEDLMLDLIEVLHTLVILFENLFNVIFLVYGVKQFNLFVG